MSLAYSESLVLKHPEQESCPRINCWNAFPDEENGAEQMKVEG